MSLSQGVQQSHADQYLDLVTKVGLDLRSLLASVDEIVSVFPGSARREVEMAHKVLSKDMAELVNAMRLAQQYSRTTLDGEYRKWVQEVFYLIIVIHKIVCVCWWDLRSSQFFSWIFKNFFGIFSTFCHDVLIICQLLFSILCELFCLGMFVFSLHSFTIFPTFCLFL